MKVLILGATGMLGHKLYQVLSSSFEVYGTVRRPFEDLAMFGFYDRARIVRVDARDFLSTSSALKDISPDVVVNAIGITKQLLGEGDAGHALNLNAIFPHQLADLAQQMGYRLITISTDCVFRGDRGNYSEEDAPDALDIYGITKRFGEIDGPGTLTLRTSIVGRELFEGSGLLEWFLRNKGGTVSGYSGAKFSGISTIELSRLIGSIIEDHPSLTGIYHVSGGPISKRDLLKLANTAFATDIDIQESNEVAMDRTLNSDRLRSQTGWRPQAWQEMMRELASDPTPYDAFHRSQM